MRGNWALVAVITVIVATVVFTASASGSDNWSRGDLNCNGAVDPDDALEVLKYDAGLPNDLPAGCPPIGPSTSPSPTQPANALPPPQDTGEVDAGGKARLTISNDSPYTLSIDFTGPESRHFDMADCPECIEWIINPIFCPEDGPQLTVDLEPGTYTVEVESGKAGILPFRGTWTLDPDTSYFSCFIIRKSLVS